MQTVSLKEAGAGFDDRFFDPNAVYDVFGFRPDPPPIPFSRETLQMHSQMGHLLVCYYDEVDGHPFRLKEMAERALSDGRNASEPGGPFFLNKGQFGPDGEILDDPYKLTNDPLVYHGTPRPGWQLVSSGILSRTRRTQVIHMLDTIVDVVEQEYFGGAVPEESVFGKALSEWNRDKHRSDGECRYPCGSDNGPCERSRVCDLLYGQGSEADASRLLIGCRMARLLLEPVQNAVYRLLLNRGSGTRLFDHGMSRTFSLLSRGGLLMFGSNDSFGGYLENNPLTAEYSNLGAVLSRMEY